MPEKLFLVSFTSYNEYAYYTIWCDDCPERTSRSYGPCCKEDGGIWIDNEIYLELAPDLETMTRRLMGKSRPDYRIENVEIKEVPFRMWQQWRRENRYSTWEFIGEDYVPRQWMFELWFT